MTALSIPSVIACLGDSLTLGADTNLHVWTARVDIDERVFPQASTANFGVSGNTIALMTTRYDLAIDGAGYSALCLQGFINDILADTPAVTIWAAVELLINRAVAAGLPVILIITSPCRGFTGMSDARQIQLLALRDLMLARADADVRVIDWYTLMGDPANPANIDPLVDYGDGLHGNKVYASRGAASVAPVAAEIFPAIEPVVETGIAIFGVTNAMIQVDYFSQMGAFTAESNPSSTSVDRFIQQKGAELGGKLRAEAQAPATIDALTTSEAYLWCQETLCLMVALRVAREMLQSPPPLAKDWQADLDARLLALAEDAEGTLGGGSASPTEQPDGPTHFIDRLGLDTSENDANASRVTFPFHKDDRL